MESTEKVTKGRSVEEILTNGRILIGKQAELPDQKLRDYIDKEYGITYQHAQDWINIVKRFGDRLEFIEGFSETALRKLSSPSLGIAIAEQIIARVHAGEISGSCRSIDREIDNYNQQE